MFYITEKDSTTGKKFSEYLQKKESAIKSAEQLSRDFGAEDYATYAPHTKNFGGGGIYCVFFPEGTKVDKKVWKEDKTYKFQRSPTHKQWDTNWTPKETSLKGKEIKEKINALPMITERDLNACVGWNESVNHVDLSISENHYGISVSQIFIERKSNPLVMPEDCKEVTYSEFKDVFKK